MKSNNSQSTQGQTKPHPPASFKGKPITDFEAYLASLPFIEDDAAFEAFECAIEEERGIRRRMAQEKPE